MIEYFLPTLFVTESSSNLWGLNFDVFLNPDNWYDIPLAIILVLLCLGIFALWGALVLWLGIAFFWGLFVEPLVKILYHLQRQFKISIPLVGDLIIKTYANLPSTKNRLLKKSELFMVSLNGIYLLKNQRLDERGMKVLAKTMGLKIASNNVAKYLEAAANSEWEDLSQEEKDAVGITVAVNGLTSNIWVRQAEEKLRETRGFFKNNY